MNLFVIVKFLLSLLIERVMRGFVCLEVYYARYCITYYFNFVVNWRATRMAT